MTGKISPNLLNFFIKNTINFPKNSSSDYGEREIGLLCIPLNSENSDIAYIDDAMKLLLSKDPVVNDMAWSELHEIADSI